MSRPYTLPNRKAFADAVARMFLKYPPPKVTEEDKDIDLCLNRSAGTRELLPHQKIVRDYLATETPYRGLLLYHGLGSGKTCSSIAVAESVLTDKKIFVMVPASLEQNYVGELQTCGAPIYLYDHHWVRHTVQDEESRKLGMSLGLSESFLNTNAAFFTSQLGEEPNYKKLDKASQDTLQAQFKDVLANRFTFIRYNGLSKNNINNYVPEDGSNPYENSVVIIDEVHNFILRVTNESEIAGKLYNLLYNTPNCKVVALSGTPVINRANEIAFLMNLLRGPIERIIVPFKATPTWDEEKMTTAFRMLPDVDTIEYNTLKKYVLLTRNPPNFRSVYNDKGDRTAVQYVKDMNYITSPSDWVSSWKTKIETEIGGAEINLDRVTVEKLECLPSDYDEFASKFLEGLQIKNPGLFQRRIQGLVSYFKGADERMLPKRILDDKMLEKVEMSTAQFNYYLNVRTDEMKASKQRASIASTDDSMKSYRVNSRLACTYMIPEDMQTIKMKKTRTTVENVEKEVEVLDKEEILKRIRMEPKKYLTKEALQESSPKLLRVLENVQASLGESGNTNQTYNNQFVYSNFRSLEGAGIFSAILDYHGWQPYKLTKENGQWVEDPEMSSDKPAYAVYMGTSGKDEEAIREYTRQIFNGQYESNFPPSLKASVERRGKKILCLFMASSAGAEGITLLNVRHVHIIEPHWNPARHDQVIGRAIRLCSHARLPQDERTVRVSFYLTVFSESQAKILPEDATNIVQIRRNDTNRKQYEGDQPVDAFMSTDEHLYEISYEKEVTNKRVSTLLKQAAVDCEIHRKLHSREKPVVTCMRFDSNVAGEDLAFHPNIQNDELDVSYERNKTKRDRTLTKVSIKGMLFLIDKLTKEVFDGPAFEDNERLLKVGRLETPNRITWIIP